MKINKISLISGLAIPLIACATIIIYQLVTADFGLSDNSILFDYKLYHFQLAFKSMIIPTAYFILLHFSLLWILRSIKTKTKLNCLTKTDVYYVWFLFIGAFILGAMLVIQSIDLRAEDLIGVNINYIVKPLIVIGFIASLACYPIINRIYSMYLSNFCSCSSNQLKVLTTQAKLLKRLAFTLVLFTGWSILPIFYTIYLYRKSIKAIN